MMLLRKGQEVSDTVLRDVLDRHALWLTNPGADRATRADFGGALLRGRGFSGCDLRRAGFAAADLITADVCDARLAEAVLDEAVLAGASLRGAILRGARLAGANLSGANLRGCDLTCADLTMANLIGATLADAVLDRTILAGVNLEGATGLNGCVHLGSSVLDAVALRRSGDIPTAFLFGCDFSEEMISPDAGFPALGELEKGCPCCIVYSDAGKATALVLHRYLSTRGLRLWAGRGDVDPGDPARAHYDTAFQRALVAVTRAEDEAWALPLIETLNTCEDGRGETVVHLIMGLSATTNEDYWPIPGGQVFHFYSEETESWSDTPELLKVLTRPEPLDLDEP